MNLARPPAAAGRSRNKSRPPLFCVTHPLAQPAGGAPLTDKNELEDLNEYLDDLIEEKAVNNTLNTFIMKLKENQPEFLTEKELNFSDEQYEQYVNIYESFTYYWDIASNISNIECTYTHYNT